MKRRFFAVQPITMVGGPFAATAASKFSTRGVIPGKLKELPPSI
jgi:hypothetical protein